MDRAAAAARTSRGPPSADAGASQYRPDIDGLRAIAVLGVVFYHYGVPGLAGGFLGVDVFFVISGYLIVGLIRREVLETGAFRFQHFYLRRVRRLFPALAVTLAASSLAAVLIFSPPHLKQFGSELISAALSVSNVYFKHQVGYFDIRSELKALLHTWSLSVEEQFYLVAPWLVVWITRWGKDRLFPVLVVLSVASVLFTEFQNGRMSAFYITPFRIFEFSLGALLLFVPERESRARIAREALLAGGLALIAASFHFLSTESRLPGLLTLLPVVGTMLVIQAGRAPGIGWILSNPFSVAIGRLSYSLYLVHWPVLTFAGYLTFEPLSAGQRALLLGLCLLLASLMHRFVERPLRRPKEVGEGGNRRFLLAACVVAAAFVILGASMALGGGWTWRLSPEGARLSASPTRQTVMQDGCQYVVEDIDDPQLQAKFSACAESRGKSVIVFGDSHAADLFNAMSFNGTRLHVTGISQPGCRPNKMRKVCFYPKLGAFLAANRGRIAGLVFTERGSSFLTDGDRLPVERADIASVATYLESVALPGVPMIWVGPQWEPIFPVQKFPVMLASYVAPNFFAAEIEAVTQADQAAAAEIGSRTRGLSYVSKLDAIGPIADGQFIVDGEFTYSDDDHWSAKGEEVFGAKLLAASGALRALFGDRRAGLAPAAGG